jgi:heptosyltransferase-2
LNSYNKILVTQTVFVGDLVLTLPLLQHLRFAYPKAAIDVLVLRGMEELLVSHPAVSSVLVYDKNGRDKGLLGIWRVVQGLRKQKYSMALVPPGSIRTAIAVFLARIPRRIGTDQSSGLLLFKGRVKFPRELKSSPNGLPVLLIECLWRFFGGRGSFVSPLFTDVVSLNLQHDAVQRHLQLLSPLGIPIQEKLLRPELYPSSTDRWLVDELLSGKVSGDMIAIAPGSVWATKRWPLDYYMSLVQELVQANYIVLLVGGQQDIEPCEHLARNIQSNRVINAYGLFTLLQSAEILKRCRVLVSNDSAPMHLAAAVGTPCVVIFGPTVPEFGFAPVGNRHIVVEKKGLWCRPCTPHGGVHCPIGTHECMTGISVDDVKRAVVRILNRRLS